MGQLIYEKWATVYENRPTPDTNYSFPIQRYLASLASYHCAQPSVGRLPESAPG